MREADSLAGLADDLRALSVRERSTVLAVLSPYERAQVAALIEATATPAPAQAAATDFSRFSPWLARHLSIDAEGAGSKQMAKLMDDQGAVAANSKQRDLPHADRLLRALVFLK